MSDFFYIYIYNNCKINIKNYNKRTLKENLKNTKYCIPNFKLN